MYLEIFWFELAAFVCSLIALPVILKSEYLRIYPVLLLIIISVEGYFKFFPQRNAVNAWVYNIQVPCQYVCYLLIIYFAAEGKQFKNFLVSALCVLIFFNVVSTIYLPAGFYNVWGYSICSVLIIIAIIWKFYEMLKNPLEFNFLRTPFFYMLFAYLLFNLITLPYFSMANWLFQTKNYKSFLIILGNVMSILNYLLYTTYSIAFIWIVRKKGIY